MVKTTTKQTAWIAAMVLGHNPTESARLAKYKGDHKHAGWENTTKPHLMTEIDAKRAELSLKVENKAEDVLKELMTIAYAQQAAGLTTGDKIRALDLLGKNTKLWDVNAGRGEQTIIIINPPKQAKTVESEVLDV